MRTIFELACPHALEEVEVFSDRAVPIGAFPAGLGQRSAMLADFIGGQAVDIRLSVFDQLNRVLIELSEII